jgi:cyclophilin family peptidyl-prolyl cis-trans isomerase
VAPVLAQIEELHPDDVLVIFRHFPLMSIHDKASLAGQAAEAAGAQGAFWEMHDYLFDHYEEWYQLAPESFVNWLGSSVSDLDIDVDEFLSDIEGGVYESVMIESFNAALSQGLSGTPSIFLNEFRFQLAPELPILEASVKLLLIDDTKFTEYPETILEFGVDYVAHIQLNIGEVIIQLYPDSAPRAVNSFLFLVNEGWFENNSIHRVLPELLIETGDPSGTGFGDPGYFFDVESDPALSFDSPGMVAITSSGPGTNGSRFFITLSEVSELNGNHTIFGRVVEGLDLLMTLDERDPLDDILFAPQAYIEAITIEER